MMIITTINKTIFIINYTYYCLYKTPTCFGSSWPPSGQQRCLSKG